LHGLNVRVIGLQGIAVTKIDRPGDRLLTLLMPGRLVKLGRQ
jgi:hypothetical protein